MQTNIEKYRKDLDRLIEKGKDLLLAIQAEFIPEKFKEAYGDKVESIKEKLPTFQASYQSWYSEAKVLIKQLLPDRLDDFIKHYEKPKNRKDINYENYRIDDCLQNLIVTKGNDWERKTIVSPSAAIPHFQQQFFILNSVNKRFESSLFDIRQIVQADPFDSELSSAKELLKKGFLRASGAVCGVVLEKHLLQVVKNHNIIFKKKNPGISDYNELLKNEGVLDVPSWRQIQRLGDIRNLCDHNKEREPTKEEVKELIDGIDKITKTLF